MSAQEQDPLLPGFAMCAQTGVCSLATLQNQTKRAAECFMSLSCLRDRTARTAQANRKEYDRQRSHSGGERASSDA